MHALFKLQRPAQKYFAIEQPGGDTFHMSKHYFVRKDIRNNVSGFCEAPAAVHFPVELFNPFLVSNTWASEAPALNPLSDISAEISSVQASGSTQELVINFWRKQYYIQMEDA